MVATSSSTIPKKLREGVSRPLLVNREGPCMSWLNTFLKRRSPLTEPSTESKDVELREGTAELDEFVARAELDKGDNLAHGANHLANLLHFDPGNREWIALFD